MNKTHKPISINESNHLVIVIRPVDVFYISAGIFVGSMLAKLWKH